MIFGFTVYTASDLIGSPATMYNLLMEKAFASPVSGNAQGSYLTMRSKSGIIVSAAASYSMSS